MIIMEVIKEVSWQLTQHCLTLLRSGTQLPEDNIESIIDREHQI